MGAKGQQKTGGRQKGTPNKATAQVKALAQVHGPQAIDELAQIAFDKHEETGLPVANAQARIAAIKELLDRGYGKSVAQIEGDFTVDDTRRRLEEMSEQELDARIRELHQKLSIDDILRDDEKEPANAPSSGKRDGRMH